MLWAWSEKARTGSGHAFVHGDAGIKLGEHEFKTFRLTRIPRSSDEHDPVTLDSEDDYVPADRVSVEDSLGARHDIAEVTRLLPLLHADYKVWCDETGYWKPQAATKAADRVTADR